MIDIFLGMIAGIGSGLRYADGGTILILLLNLFLNLVQQQMQGINLIFFIPTSIVAIYINTKNKLIDFKIAKWLILFGIVGTILGANLAIKMNSNSLKKYFGIFLIIIALNGFYTLTLQYIKNKTTKNK